ncbi:MAG: hypothetical protein MJZ19_01855 [Paludibacteraceae bacterium]|nr:hypothetical protein [Paludibacteraceae bacterium]
MKKLIQLIILAICLCSCQTEAKKQALIKELEKEKISELCGLKIGTDYEQAKKHFDNLFGPSTDIDNDGTYRNVTYNNKPYQLVSIKRTEINGEVLFSGIVFVGEDKPLESVLKDMDSTAQICRQKFPKTFKRKDFNKKKGNIYNKGLISCGVAYNWTNDPSWLRFYSPVYRYDIGIFKGEIFSRDVYDFSAAMEMPYRYIDPHKSTKEYITYFCCFGVFLIIWAYSIFCLWKSKPSLSKEKYERRKKLYIKYIFLGVILLSLYWIGCFAWRFWEYMYGMMIMSQVNESLPVLLLIFFGIIMPAIGLKLINRDIKASRDNHEEQRETAITTYKSTSELQLYTGIEEGYGDETVNYELRSLKSFRIAAIVIIVSSWIQVINMIVQCIRWT